MSKKIMGVTVGTPIRPSKFASELADRVEEMVKANTEQEKTVDITENGTVEIVPDEGYKLTKVTANVNIGGENKLAQLADKSITVVTADDLKGATSIGNYTFYRCNNLMSITIPDSITKIDYSGVDDCYKLVEVINKSSLEIKKGNTNYGDLSTYALEVHSGDSKIVNKGGYFFYPYEGVNYLVGYTGTDTDLTLPTNYNGENYVINQYAFVNDSKITNVIIPDGVTKILKHAFRDCSNLTNVTFPDTVTSIGDSAFYRSGITSATIPDGIRVEKYAFMSCKSLTSVIVGALTDGGEQIFRACTNLKNVTLADGLTQIYGSMFNECASLESITIPNSVTLIGSSAFGVCTSLKSVNIPDGVTNLYSYAFASCTSLTSVTIPNSCTWLWEAVFNGCTSLTSITIPASVERIRNSLHIGSAENKATITFLGTTPASIYANTFNAEYLEKIIVPKGCGEVYKTATNWANWADYIEEMAE